MLPFVTIAIVVAPDPVTLVTKLFTVSLCGNGASEVPRYHVMVGTGVPVEKQEILTESPSSTVTSPVRFMVIGSPVFNYRECNRVTSNIRASIKYTHSHQAGKSQYVNPLGPIAPISVMRLSAS